MRINDLLCAIDDIPEDQAHANTQVGIILPDGTALTVEGVTFDLPKDTIWIKAVSTGERVMVT